LETITDFLELTSSRQNMEKKSLCLYILKSENMKLEARKIQTQLKRPLTDTRSTPVEVRLQCGVHHNKLQLAQ